MNEKQEVPPQVAQTKQFRQDLDKVLQRIKRDSELDPSVTGSDGRPAIPMGYRASQERSYAIKKLQEAIMWLGMDLKAMSEEGTTGCVNPYPQSYNPDSPVIEKTADGLKL